MAVRWDGRGEGEGEDGLVGGVAVVGLLPAKGGTDVGAVGQPRRAELGPTPVVATVVGGAARERRRARFSSRAKVLSAFLKAFQYAWNQSVACGTSERLVQVSRAVPATCRLAGSYRASRT